MSQGTPTPAALELRVGVIAEEAGDRVVAAVTSGARLAGFANRLDAVSASVDRAGNFVLGDGHARADHAGSLKHHEPGLAGFSSCGAGQMKTTFRRIAQDRLPVADSMLVGVPGVFTRPGQSPTKR